MEFKEGDTATNPQTGERIILQNNQWVPLGMRESGISPTQRGGFQRFMGNALNIPETMLRRGVIDPINQAMRPVVKAGETAAAFATGNFDQFSSDPRMAGNTPLFAGDLDLAGAPGSANNATSNVINPGQGRILPQVEPNDILAGAEVLGERVAQTVTGSDVPPVSFRDARNRQDTLDMQARQQSPGEYFAGEVMGDIATLTGGRQSGAAVARTFRERALTNLARLKEKTGTRGVSLANSRNIGSALNNLIRTHPNMRKAWQRMAGSGGNQRALQSTVGRSLGSRTVEAGFEGAVLGMLSEGNPEEMFGYAAGTQMAGGMLLSGLDKVFQGGVLKAGGRLALAAGGIGALIQILGDATGGEQSLLPSFEAGFDKVTMGLALGAFSGLAGSGRIANGFPTRAFPQMADVLTSFTRNGVQSMMNDINNDPRIRPILDRAATNPDFFGPKATRIMLRAIENPDISFSETVDGLMENADFRIKFEALQ